MEKIAFYLACERSGLSLPVLHNKTVLDFYRLALEKKASGCPFTSLSQDFMRDHGFTWVNGYTRSGRTVRGHWRSVRGIAQIEAILKLQILARAA